MTDVLGTGSGDAIITGDGSLIGVNTGLPTGTIQAFDFGVPVERALLWEYNKALNLQSLVEQKQEWYNTNQDNFWNDWINNVFNLKTANEFGLSVWSIILGLPLFISNPPDPDKPTFGFDLPSYGNFDNSNFTDTGGTLFNLPLEIKRLALRLRYYQLISSGTVPEINRTLADVFAPYGKVYLADFHNMTQAYIFDFPIPANMMYLFNNIDILPRPAGVLSSIIDGTKEFFGFDAIHLNFDNGNFGA